jgi:cyanophycinase
MRLLLGLLLLGPEALWAQDAPRGHLVIIGGGRRGPEIMQRFVDLCGGPNGKIVLFPMASAYADSGIGEQIEGFTRYGARSVVHLNISRIEADRDSIVHQLDGATGIYFAGGDQSRLTAALKGTRVEQRLHEIYRTGGTIGGTSAGAAVMSQMMITGDERANPDSTNPYSFIRPGNIVTAEGFGFVEDAIVDQHFIRRKRFQRLLSLVLEHPAKLGIGIDEGTAVVMKPDRTFEVVGEATVLVIDASNVRNIGTNPKNDLAASGIMLHLLKSGDRFDRSSRTVMNR